MDFCFFMVILVCSSQLPRTHASSCQDLTPAKTFWKKIKSPGYPSKFNSQTQCNWIIRAPQGYRVELEFEAFYLVGGVLEGCFSQLLKITDMFSRVTDGPYCGNTLPPRVVSTGHSLRITLESNAVGRGYHYEGFKAQFRKTRQPSSIRLRDINGQWRYYNVAGGEVLITTTTTAPPVATRDPNEVDDNNNAAIDAQNNAINHQQMNNNEQVNMQNNAQNAPPTPDLPQTPTTKKRTPPVRIPASTTTSPRFSVRNNNLRNRNSLNDLLNRPAISSSDAATSLKNETPPRNVVIRDKSNSGDEDSESLSPNGVIGIAVAAVMIFLIALLLATYFVRKRRETNKESTNTKTRKTPEINTVLKPAAELQSKKSSNHHHSQGHAHNNRRHQKTNKDYSNRPETARKSHTSKSNQHSRPRSRERRASSKAHRSHRTMR